MGIGGDSHRPASEMLDGGGFALIEDGKRTAMRYFLAKKRSSTALRHEP